MSGSPFTNAPYGFFSAGDFLALELPEREALFSPWLLTSSINMLYAKTGVGKSNFALGLSVALARGKPFLGFTPARQGRVVYVDGEMPGQELQRRLNALTGCQNVEGLYLYSMAMAEKPFRVPSLNAGEGQEALMRMVDSVAPDLLVLDNKSTLFSNVRENEAGTWDGPQQWLMSLRASGMAVLLLHHAGKNGLQRGSSMHDVVNDIILELYEPEGPSPEVGSQFVLEFEKKRHMHGHQCQPLLVRLNMGKDSAQWSHELYKGGRKADPRRQEAITLRQRGLSMGDIAKMLGASKSTVHGWVQET